MSDGVTVAFHRWAPPELAARRALPPVILHHGFDSDTDISWVDPGMVTALLDADREVFSVDARGHGSSDKPHDSALYGETRMSRDVVELCDALGLDRVDLVGHSMGAVVAMITATSDVGRIRRMVISGVGSHQLDYDGAPLRHFDTVGLAEALAVDDPSSISEQGLRDERADVDARGADRLALAAHLRVMHSDAFAFDEISAPTLVIAGADDPISPRPERLAEVLPQGRALVLAGGHASVKNTLAYIDTVVSFLAG
jgi:pimeloyl-ACP methyl ester carboxylesterase